MSLRLLALGALAASLLVPSASAATFADPYNPDASFVVSDEPRRVGQPIEFVALADGYSRYHWSFGDGSFGRGLEAEHRYREPGRYVVMLEVVTAGGAYAAKSMSLTVHSAPSPDSLPTLRGRVARSHKDPSSARPPRRSGSSSPASGAPAVLCWSDRATLTGPKYEIVAGFVEYRSPRQVNLSPESASAWSWFATSDRGPGDALHRVQHARLHPRGRTHARHRKRGGGYVRASADGIHEPRARHQRCIRHAARGAAHGAGGATSRLATGAPSAMDAGGSTWSPRREAGRYLSDLGDARASPRRGSALTSFWRFVKPCPSSSNTTYSTSAPELA